jgi:hypothetical protein
MARRRRNLDVSKINGMKNKRMNNEVYQLRRKVMNFIYEARDMAGDKFRRIDVRITEGKHNKKVLACAWMENDAIWVDENTAADKSEDDLRQTVFHELLHALLGVEHDEKCPLMRSVHKSISRKEQDKHFQKYFA